MSETDLYLSCARCGRPAALGPHGEGEHHTPPDRSSKGAGGTAIEPPQVPLCREHHEQLHRKLFKVLVNGDFVSTTTMDGHVQSERALVVNDRADDPRYWSDLKLGVMIAQALERSADMIYIVGQCAFEYQRRYGYGDHWAEELAAFVREETGQTRGYSPRQLEYWAKEFPVFRDKPDDWRLLAGRIAHAIARDTNPNEAMEIATVSLLSGTPRMAVVEELRERQGREPPEMCVCVCGNRHRRKE